VCGCESCVQRELVRNVVHDTLAGGGGCEGNDRV
jgi:hypothetical protein